MSEGFDQFCIEVGERQDLRDLFFKAHHAREGEHPRMHNLGSSSAQERCYLQVMEVFYGRKRAQFIKDQGYSPEDGKQKIIDLPSSLGNLWSNHLA